MSAQFPGSAVLVEIEISTFGILRKEVICGLDVPKLIRGPFPSWVLDRIHAVTPDPREAWIPFVQSLGKI